MTPAEERLSRRRQGVLSDAARDRSSERGPDCGATTNVTDRVSPHRGRTRERRRRIPTRGSRDLARCDSESDGCRLAARFWLPEGAERHPSPPSSSHPVRKRIGTRDRDEAMHRWFAGHGIARAHRPARSGSPTGCCSTSTCLESMRTASRPSAGSAQPWCTAQSGSWEVLGGSCAADRGPQTQELRAS